MSSCSAYGCTNRPEKRTPGVTFHLFPKDKVRRRAWTIALKRKDFTPSRFTRVCSEHFAEECFDRSKKCVRLKPNAVPTIFRNFPEHMKNISSMAPLTDFQREDFIKKEMDSKEENLEGSVNDEYEENYMDDSLDESILQVASIAPLTDFVTDDFIKKEMDSEEENLEGSVNDEYEENYMDDNLDESVGDNLDESIGDNLEGDGMHESMYENLDSLSESLSSEDETSSEDEPPETDVVYVSDEKSDGNESSSLPRVIKVVPNGASGEIVPPSQANLDKKILDSLSSYLKYQECSETLEAHGGPTVSVIFVQPPPSEAYPLIPYGKNLGRRRKPNNLEYRIINQTRKIKAMNRMNERYQVKIAQLEKTIENLKNPTTSDEDELSEDDITIDEIYHEMLKRQRLEDDTES